MWYPSEDPRARGRDVHHFNSVWRDGEHLFLVAHNHGPSEVWEVCASTREVQKKYLSGKHVHNVWREDGVLTMCSSGTGTVETVDGRVLCKVGQFPRGVVIHPEFNAVGVSTVAHRSNRLMAEGSIDIFTKQWGFIRKIPLGRCGQVTELRGLGPDLAHNGLAPPTQG